MSDLERAQETNGIWLCRSCHKLIDDDVKRYPPELLFKWREVHDEFTASQLENAGSWARLEVQREFFDNHPNLTPAARRILADKPDFWECLLTLELLRSSTSVPKQKMTDLLSGAYVPQFKVIAAGHEPTFFQRKFFELKKLIASAKQIFTVQLFTSWGEDGHSGDEITIIHIGSLIQKLSDAFATWEEEIHSVYFEREVFLETNEVLKGCGNHNFKQIEMVQDLVAEVIQTVNTPEEGRSLDFKHTMVFDFPSGFDDRFEKALNFAKQELLFDEI